MEIVSKRNAEMPPVNRSIHFTINYSEVTNPYDLIKNLSKSFLQLEKAVEIAFVEVYEPTEITPGISEFFNMLKMWSATPKGYPVETTIKSDSGVITVRSIIYGKPK